MSLDVRLIAILDPVPLGERALDAARAAEAGGATILQVRMKDSPADDLLRWTDRLVKALTIPVMVNDRADVAWLAGAAGVHLGADDLPAARVRRHSPSPFAVGVSVGIPDEAAAVQSADVDYWSIGSVYATPSKPDAGAPIGAAGFRELASRAPRGMPCVAIGGITVERVPELRGAGVAGVAVIGAIFGAVDVERAARLLRDAMDAPRRLSGEGVGQ
ncbi:MAG: thiamine phosphate synthase [Gemmatimonadota bacterium]|nr:thiamine phosphate synthase [Gemmatimonadota bacterium]